MKLVKACLFACAVCAGSAMAQSPVWDASGNSQLNGNYYFRQVLYASNAAYAYYGGVSFDGNGNWTISGAQAISSGTGATQGFSASGTYSISAAGFGFMTSPADSSSRVYVTVANGIIAGSATDNTGQYADLFVAAPLASPQPTVASLQGTYQLSYFRPDYYNGSQYDEDALIQMSSTGKGQINASMNGYYAGSGSQVYTQISNSLPYIYSNGAANITFPNNNNAAFIYGENEYLYMSADGNFVFGGSPTDYDFFVGVKTNAANPAGFSGLFYQAGLDDDSTNNGALDGWYGSFNALGGNLSGSIVSHERAGYGSGGIGETFADSFGSFTAGGYTDTATYLQYVFSQNGAIRIGFGLAPYLGINVAFQAPTLTGSGVYLNPQGITNSASSAPFTAGISAGELITLYGSKLAAGTVVANSLPWPTSLGDVSSVKINNVSAPIYYVSATQISVVVPFATNSSIAQIQVTNGSGASNVITTPVNQTTPGVYTISSAFGGAGPGGFGFAAAEHADYSVVSSSNPAQPGETIQLYVTGLGPVTPSNPDGAAGPSNPFSVPANTIALDVGGTVVATPLPFIGLAPALAGLYQINFQIPTGLAAGEYLVGITGPDSYSNEAVIQVGNPTSQTSSAAAPLVAGSPSMRIPRRAAESAVRARSAGPENHARPF